MKNTPPLTKMLKHQASLLPRQWTLATDTCQVTRKTVGEGEEKTKTRTPFIILKKPLWGGEFYSHPAGLSSKQLGLSAAAGKGPRRRNNQDVSSKHSRIPSWDGRTFREGIKTQAAKHEQPGGATDRNAASSSGKLC